MYSKEKVMKILEGLSLDELREAQSCIDNIIARTKEAGSKSQEKSYQEDYRPIERREQERFYEIFSCKLERADKQGEVTFQGTVVDISKAGLRLKTKNNFAKSKINLIVNRW